MIIETLGRIINLTVNDLLHTIKMISVKCIHDCDITTVVVHEDNTYDSDVQPSDSDDDNNDESLCAGNADNNSDDEQPSAPMAVARIM